MGFVRIGQSREMLSVIVDTSGLDRLNRETPGMVRHMLAYIAVAAAGEAQQNIRAVGAIDTGFMVNSTRARKVNDLLWTIGTAAPYGVFVEWGTRLMPARPWLMPAVVAARGRFAKALADGLRGLA